MAATYERNVYALTLQLADWTDPLVIQLTPEADRALIAYEERLEPQLRAKGGRLGHIDKWAGKLVGATARIAGLLHLATHIDGGHHEPISEATLRAATEIADYFTAHALTVFDLMGADTSLARARVLLTALEHNGWESITRRDLFAKLSRSEFPTVAELEPALALLEEHGYLRTDTPPRTGKRGRPCGPSVRHPPQRPGAQGVSPRWSCTPWTPPHKPQNPQKPAGAPSDQRRRPSSVTAAESLGSPAEISARSWRRLAPRATTHFCGDSNGFCGAYRQDPNAAGQAIDPRIYADSAVSAAPRRPVAQRPAPWRNSGRTA